MASAYPTTAAGTAGETGADLGVGTGVYDSKTGNVLQFRSFVGGAGIALSEAGGEITVAAPGTDVTLGSAGGVPLVGAGTGPALTVKGLTAGTGATLASDATTVTVGFTGEANTASDLGAGAGVFSAKVGADLRFRSVSGGGSVAVTQDAPSAGTVQIALTGTGGVSSPPWLFTRVLASGVAGGAAANGAWTTAALNTAGGNAAADIQLAVAPAGANQLRFATGTYWVLGSTSMARVGLFRARLQNVSDGTTAVLGTSEHNQTSGGAGGATTTRSRVVGVFAVAAGPKVVELQYYVVASAGSTQEQGYPLALAGYTEEYNQLVIAKIQT